MHNTQGTSAIIEEQRLHMKNVIAQWLEEFDKSNAVLDANTQIGPQPNRWHNGNASMILMDDNLVRYTYWALGGNNARVARVGDHFRQHMCVVVLYVLYHLC